MLSPIAYGQFSADRENIATSGAEEWLQACTKSGAVPSSHSVAGLLVLATSV